MSFMYFHAIEDPRAIASPHKLLLKAVASPRKLLKARYKPQALQLESLAFDNGAAVGNFTSLL